MQSPALSRISLLLLLCAACGGALALSWADISNPDAVAGLKSALDTATVRAVDQLGAQGGFLDNAKVRIPLPGYMEQARGVLDAMGMKKKTKRLQETMNRAAELAVVEAKPIFVNAIKSMNVQDAKAIISGGQDSGTQFFRNKTSDVLRAKFLPVVKKTTDKLGLAQQYNEYAAKGAALGVLKPEHSTIEAFVTQKALDGLFLMMAEQEQAIRRDPVGAGSAIVSKVFGAFGH